ncbi:DUF6307 family protein [Lentzea sp. NPDC058450]|uniref:DUF6307 family protein n=1 Tax=Lentzea sp. NPDC058450 TaxID=3346505 RepID=UPI0036537BEA
MTAPPYLTTYERRLKTVQDVVTSRTGLGDQAALELAVHVLRALDHIPERVR